MDTLEKFEVKKSFGYWCVYESGGYRELKAEFRCSLEGSEKMAIDLCSELNSKEM